ncbi:MAG TPA: winged helix-turn-helix domain-containing protein, partial [Acidobacteriaceae bacterium]|nr:winged helix-turn-helix domain-containing protein [Acidobacteriaceae bacterium]
EAWLEDVPLHLTSVEFTLLEVFMQKPSRILPRELLTRKVLGRKLGPFDRVIDVHVSNLRKKLGGSEGGQRIRAVRGSGYLFAARPDTRDPDHA